jgi:hypothetical protein
MKGLREKITNIFVNGLVYFTAGWCVIALCMQLFFVVLHFSGNDEIAGNIANEMTIRLDGNYSDNPKNFWYKK